MNNKVLIPASLLANKKINKIRENKEEKVIFNQIDERLIENVFGCAAMWIWTS